jgi:hypothetical protein
MLVVGNIQLNEHKNNTQTFGKVVHNAFCQDLAPATLFNN